MCKRWKSIVVGKRNGSSARFRNGPDCLLPTPRTARTALEAKPIRRKPNPATRPDSSKRRTHDSVLKTYKWGEAPPSLFTRNQLREQGRRPKKDARPQNSVVWGRGRSERVAYLYALEETQPLRECTPAQRSALEKAFRARCTCPRCLTVFDEVVGGRGWRCSVCAERHFRRVQNEAVRDAVEMLSRDYVFVDFETASLYGEAVEFAAVLGTGDIICNTLVKPVGAIDTETTAIHGIAEADVASAPPFADVLRAIADMLQGRTLVAWNAEYDKDVMKGECERAGIELVVQWRCAMQLWGMYKQGRRQGFRERLDGGHRALSDCLTMFSIVRYVARQLQG
ncbi:MAG: 3'-5' exonuclease [Desulfurellales bacterium]|nr:MAG: 3'-5' exonuclease [Desulfurellales bacterium]